MFEQDATIKLCLLRFTVMITLILSDYTDYLDDETLDFTTFVAEVYE